MMRSGASSNKGETYATTERRSEATRAKGGACSARVMILNGLGA